MHGSTLWTPAETSRMRILASEGYTMREAAVRLERSLRAVESKSSSEGISFAGSSPTEDIPVPWTEDEELTLTSATIDGAGLSQLMTALPGRSETEIRTKQEELLPNYVFVPLPDREWTEREDEILLEGRRAGMMLRDLGYRLPGRTKNAIISRANRIGAHLPTNEDGSRMSRVPVLPATAMGPRPKTCQWIDGDVLLNEDWSYCGEPVEEGKSYCAAHCARAYRREGGQEDVDREAAYAVGSIKASLASSARLGR